MHEVQDVPKLPGDSREVPISAWSGWRCNSRCKIFSLLDQKKLLQEHTHCKVSNKPHSAHKGFLSRIRSMDSKFISECPILVGYLFIHMNASEMIEHVIRTLLKLNLFKNLLVFELFSFECLNVLRGGLQVPKASLISASFLILQCLKL